MVDKKVSVIIPTYKGENVINRAIDSVLNQTYKTLEIIVVDDNNPDSMSRNATECAINQYQGNSVVKYIKHKANKNGAAARNTGIAQATGEYVTFLDDDDFLLPERVEESVKALEASQKYDLVFCGVISTVGKLFEKVVVEETSNKSKELLLINHGYIGSGSNIFMRTGLITEIGGFDESFIRHQDLEFLVRALRKHKALWINAPLVVKAVGAANNMPNFEKYYESKMQYFKKFERDINALAPSERAQFINNHYTFLLIMSLSVKTDKRTEIIKQLKKVRKIRIIEELYLITANIPIREYTAFYYLKKLRISNKIKRSERVKRSLPMSVSTFIEDRM